MNIVLIDYDITTDSFKLKDAAGNETMHPHTEELNDLYAANRVDYHGSEKGKAIIAKWKEMKEIMK